MRVVLDLRKTVEQNAADYFERAKKLKNKAKGARVAVTKFKAQLAARESRPSPAAPAKTVIVKEATSRLWYEKFRWFLSSEGYLCVGGRDAGSNEVIVKKHTEPHDLLCHTEAPGSPFFVIKTEGNPPSPATIEEASQATASYSRGWKLGVGVMDAYCVTPEQVSKEAQSGEFMSKGSFMVRGKRQTLRVPLKLAVGLLPDGRIMGGPERAVRKHCAKVMLVTHGGDKPSDAAKKVQKHLGGGTLDDIIRVLPSGEVKVAGT